ncbi:lipopolysaccharide transport periplasmic protein LptA [Aliidiomarina sp. Khilg15.8]
MFKPFIILSAVFSSLLLVLPAQASAERDFEQPIQVEADHEELDLRANRLMFRDNVIVRQGSLTITADRLEVEGSESGEAGESEVFVATGSPATYQQTVDVELTVNAQANEIRYDAATRILTLRGNAQMSQSGNQVSASQITYYVDEQRVTAERDESSEERVTTIFQPRQRTQPDDESNNGNP